jgi:hypothetical protein
VCVLVACLSNSLRDALKYLRAVVDVRRGIAFNDTPDLTKNDSIQPDLRADFIKKEVPRLPDDFCFSSFWERYRLTCLEIKQS